MAKRLKVNEIAKHPIESIQGVVALTLLIFGVYILMPFYVAGPGAATATDAFAGNLGLRAVFCIIFFVLPGLSTLLSFKFPKYRTATWRARGCFYMFTGICFLTTLRLLTVGVNPPIWLFYLGLGLISGVLYLYWLVQE